MVLKNLNWLYVRDTLGVTLQYHTFFETLLALIQRWVVTQRKKKCEKKKLILLSRVAAVKESSVTTLYCHYNNNNNNNVTASFIPYKWSSSVKTIKQINKVYFRDLVNIFWENNLEHAPTELFYWV